MAPRHLAITMGDPAGIGPETIVKAAARLRPRLVAGELALAVIGSNATLEQARALRAGSRHPRGGGGRAGLARALRAPGRARGRADPSRPALGRWRALRLSRRRARRASRPGRARRRPRHRPAQQGGAEPGRPPLSRPHRDAGRADRRDRLPCMMLAHGNMRVSHLTTHIALEEVPRRVTPERLRRVIGLTHDALRRLGTGRARIAVAALNPHAGEGGLFGRHDIDAAAPAIAGAVAAGMDVVGPVPGDTVFVKLRAGQYDAVIANYHDQGHIPVKLLGFEVDPETGKWNDLSGVNITLGLPIIRTSVDHGTAFDIAGQGIANERSLVEAIEYAERLARPAARAVAA